MADAYETEFMSGGDVIAREKFVVPRWVLAIFVAAFAIPAAATLLTGAPIWLSLLTVLPAVPITLLMSVIRVSVSNEALHIQYGVMGPKIAIGKIIEAEAVDYRALDYGGWGVRYQISTKTRIYNTIGDAGRALRVRYDDDGVLRTVLVSSRDPERLVAAIEQAKRGRTLADARQSHGVSAAPVVDQRVVEEEVEIVKQ